ncbi:MAG: hypothetical protein AB8B55_16230 [Mariniblastus sp.]
MPTNVDTINPLKAWEPLTSSISQEWLMDPLLEDIGTICELPNETTPIRYELIPPAQRFREHILARNRPIS